ncbi:hypothetical protein SESBI_36555 [Sesbania bispinosa]|nr:hypothetical protein SESBI_36555 [Sesbania bispinosa]
MVQLLPCMQEHGAPVVEGDRRRCGGCWSRVAAAVTATSGVWRRTTRRCRESATTRLARDGGHTVGLKGVVQQTYDGELAVA